MSIHVVGTAVASILLVTTLLFAIIVTILYHETNASSREDKKNRYMYTQVLHIEY
jgi:hypothetical protein